ncbi:MAG: succinylglutamate desuccinylase/aspartoacylase family protein [Bdellovibrionales bacterium]|nr:succinylglutamate desuccinylase/aspartoacylase family protein [Bdellovibrionales bacterium]
MTADSFLFGTTADGLGIPGWRWNAPRGPKLFVLGGVHGDEPEGVVAAHGLLASLLAGPPKNFSLTLVPALNLDGVLAQRRKNSRGIDLNRNMGTRDWTSEVASERYFPGDAPDSEPETLALIRFLESERPTFILSLHSWKPLLNTNGDCVPEAAAAAAICGYSVSPTIGYPTPGCLGTWAGLERDMPTLTYEVERGQPPDRIVQMHVPAVLAALRTAADRRS